MKEELFEASQTDWYKKHVHISGGFKVGALHSLFPVVPSLRIR